jgi:hypothetical protein
MRSVLRAALDSGDGALASEARATISRLYALRDTEFNDLLELRARPRAQRYLAVVGGRRAPSSA